MLVAPHAFEMPPRWKIRESMLCRAPFCGRDTDWEVHLVKVPASKWPILWFRPLDESCDAGFTALDDYLDQTMFFPQRAKLSSLSTTINSALQYGVLARQFFLNEQGTLRAEGEKACESVVAGANGAAGWNLAFVRKEVFSPASFKWSKRFKHAGFQRLSAQDVWGKVQELLEHPKGEAAFAREFALLTDEERAARVQRTKRGDFGQMESLLRDLVLSSSLWDEQPGATQIYLATTSGTHASLWEETTFEELEAPPTMREGISKLWRYFRPFNRRIARFRCVKYSYSGEVFVEAARPSAHERLEAHFRWRAFEEQTR